MLRQPGNDNYLYLGKFYSSKFQSICSVIQNERTIFLDSTTILPLDFNLLEKIYCANTARELPLGLIKKSLFVVDSMAEILGNKKTFYISKYGLEDLKNFRKKFSEKIKYLSANKIGNKDERLLRLPKKLEQALWEFEKLVKKRIYNMQNKDLQDLVKEYLQKTGLLSNESQRNTEVVSSLLYRSLFEKSSIALLTKDSRNYLGARNLCADLIKYFKEYKEILYDAPVLGYYFKNDKVYRFNSRFLEPREMPLPEKELLKWKSLL